MQKNRAKMQLGPKVRFANEGVSRSYGLLEYGRQCLLALIGKPH